MSTYELVGWQNDVGPTTYPGLVHMDEGIRDAHTMAGGVATIAELKAIPAVQQKGTVIVQGYYSAGDGGGGLFRYNASGTATQNGGTIITPDSGGGRWERLYQGPINLLWFGAQRGDTGDQKAAFDAATLAAVTGGGGAGGGEVFIPKGTYRFTTAPTPRWGLVLSGEGNASVLHWASTGIFYNLVDAVYHNIWQNLAVYGDAASYTLLQLSQTFNHRFNSVVFQGTHSTTTPQASQRGVNIIVNAGDNHFTSCRWIRLGEPVVTDSIQNYISQGHFSECRNGIIGETTRTTSGMAIMNTSFATTAHANNLTHIDIRGSGSAWWIQGCWFEGAQSSVIIGRSGIGGPAQFGMVNCVVSSSTINIDVQACRQPYFANIQFAGNPPSVPTNIAVNAGGASRGTAINLINLTTASEIPLSTFPADWLVFSDTHMQAPFNGVQIGGFSSIVVGSGSPEGVVTATLGSLYLRVSGAAANVLYVKETASGNTGWVGK